MFSSWLSWVLSLGISCDDYVSCISLKKNVLQNVQSNEHLTYVLPKHKSVFELYAI